MSQMQLLQVTITMLMKYLQSSRRFGPQANKYGKSVARNQCYRSFSELLLLLLRLSLVLPLHQKWCELRSMVVNVRNSGDRCSIAFLSHRYGTSYFIFFFSRCEIGLQVIQMGHKYETWLKYPVMKTIVTRALHEGNLLTCSHAVHGIIKINSWSLATIYLAFQ